jgi:hypothetical protein
MASISCCVLALKLVILAWAYSRARLPALSLDSSSFTQSSLVAKEAAKVQRKISDPCGRKYKVLPTKDNKKVVPTSKLVGLRVEPNDLHSNVHARFDSWLRNQ